MAAARSKPSPASPDDRLWTAIKRLETLSLHGSVAEDVKDLKKSVHTMSQKLQLIYKLYVELNSRLTEKESTHVDYATLAQTSHLYDRKTDTN